MSVVATYGDSNVEEDVREPQWLEGLDEDRECHYNWQTCLKHPGHAGFLAYRDFCFECLPTGIRTVLIYQLILAICDLTVRIRIKKVSESRPKDGSYYSLPNGGVYMGTGFVRNCARQEGTCPCADCMRSPGGPQTTYWSFDVRTALHLVFDHYEASHTTAELYFDTESSRLENTLKPLTWVCVINENKMADMCVMKCVTHDPEVAGRVSSCLALWDSLRQDMTERDWSGKRYHTVIVAHPHGQPKMITLGRRVYLPWKERCFPKSFVYTAKTCSGSSGAGVWFLGHSAEDDHYWSLEGVHHCVASRKSGCNYGHRWMWPTCTRLC